MRITCLLAAALVLPAALPAQGIEPAALAGLEFRNLGPSRGGRVTTVTGVRGRPGTYYFGATGGGVWKTTNYGQEWRPISDGFFATGSIGAIRVAAVNPDIIYVGTGSDGIRSNVILGRGVYRSDDGGRTWRHIGLGEVGQIGAVEIHPTEPATAFVAAIGNPFKPTPDRGVYRTRDGGATWQRVLFLSDSTGAVDLEFAPDDPNTIYAGMWRAERKPWTIISGAQEGGIYKSTNGGDSWTKLGGGLPTGLIGKSDLAVSAADPDRLYVLLEADPGAGLYRSDDRGTSFRLISTERETLRRPFYYLNVDADPSNADVVFSNSEDLLRSTDGGASWTRIDTPHGDNHDIWIDPVDPQVWVQSNDGGANVTRDGGRTWSTQSNQSTAELYQVAVDDRFPYWAYAGQQDNTTIGVPSLPPFDAIGGVTTFWRDIGGCETGPAIPKPGDPDIVYSNCKGQFGRFNQRTGQEKHYWVGGQYLYGHNPKDLTYRFQRVAPIHVSPHDPNTVYHGSQYLHRTRDEGVTWETISPDLTAFEPDKQVVPGTPITRDITGEEYYSTVYAIRESPLEAGVIWVGANDGPVHVTRDGGRTWQKVTPPGLPPGGRVQHIDASPHHAGTAYIAVYRYLLGDFAPYIYRTRDYGSTWTRLTTGANGIPADYPTRVVREDPDVPGLLYAGTEFGLFLSTDDGATWQSFQQNLPVTPVTDIALTRKDLVLSTMGRGFWLLDDLSRIHQLARPGQLSGPITVAGHRLFTPRETPMLRYGVRRLGLDVSYPPPGGLIDYTIGEGAPGAVLEIIDSTDRVVRRFEPGQNGFNASPGSHRFRWDFTAEGPTTAGGRPAGNGPRVPPGIYQVRLSIGEWQGNTLFRLVSDPRVVADGVTEADLREQYHLARAVAKSLSDARRTAASVQTLRQRGGLSAAQQATVNEAHDALVTDGGIYPQPKLVDQFNYLYSLVTRADQKPGRDAHRRLEELNREHEALLARLRTVPGWDDR